jgi:hypothetical protein
MPLAGSPTRSPRRSACGASLRCPTSPADAGPRLAPLQQLGTPLADLTATMPYVDSQSAVDALFPDGGRYYWKSHFVDEMSDELIDTLVALDAGRPSPQSVIMIRTPSAALSAASATTRPPTRRAIAVPFDIEPQRSPKASA